MRVLSVEQHRREFAEFYATARDDCLRIVLISVGNRQLAEDLVADAFTKAWMSWRKVQGFAEPRAWVVRAALNAHVSWWRRHRREVALDGHDGAAGLSAAAACATAGLVVALALPSNGQPRPVHVNLAAWSVNTRPDGTVTFRLRNTSDPARLQQALAAAGVPAMVRWREICLAQGQHVLLPTWGFLSGPGQPGHQDQLGSVLLVQGAPRGSAHDGSNVVLNWAFTIDPAKIPSGGHFVISARPGNVGPGQIQAEWEFVPVGAHVVCR